MKRNCKSRDLGRILGGLIVLMFLLWGSPLRAIGIVPPDDLRSLFQIPDKTHNLDLVSKMDCPSPSALGFDSKNRPYEVDAFDPSQYGFVTTLRNGKWIRHSFIDALIKAGINYKQPTLFKRTGFAHISFDAQDGLYILVPRPRVETNGVTINGDMVLLYSSDLGEHFRAYPLNGCRPYATEMESAYSGQSLSNPPSIAWVQDSGKKEDSVTTVAAPWPDCPPLHLKYATKGDLMLLLPEKKGNGLRLSAPLKISDRANLGPSKPISIGNKVYLGYIEIPKDRLLPQGANPTFVAKVSRSPSHLENREHLIDAMPMVSDGHSVPLLLADASSTLHLITGSHGWSPSHLGFYYLKATKPDQNTAWSTPQLLGMGQSYPHGVCDSKGNIHLIFRTHPLLQYLKRDAKSGLWSRAINLVEAPRERLKEYNNFYQRLWMDHQDNLYARVTCSDVGAGALGNDDQGAYPQVLLVSEDGGSHWAIASTKFFQKYGD